MLHIQGNFVGIFRWFREYFDFIGRDNDLQEKITYLFNQVFLFLSLKKTTANESLNILKTCFVIWGNFDWFQVCFVV